MNSNRYELFSDGGGTMDSDGGCGTILRNSTSGQEFYIATYLGRSTNNEAEICAGLVGFSLIQALMGSNNEKKPTYVHWISDSEYVLKSATQYIHGWTKNGWKTTQKQPVKNKGLWLAYLDLSNGYHIEPEHVRGHSGHSENEACDKASTFARMNGSNNFKSYNNKPIEVSIDCGKEFKTKKWYLADGRPFLQFLRNDVPTSDEIFWFSKVFSRNILDYCNSNCNSSICQQTGNTAKTEISEVELFKELGKIRKTAQILEQKSSMAKTVRVALDVLIVAINDDFRDMS